MMPAINEVMLAVSSSLAASIIVKATVVAALALIGTRLARSSRAAVRHALLAAAFGVLLLLPVASILAPPIRVALLGAAPERIAPLPFAASVSTIPAVTPADERAGIAHAIPRWSSLSLSAVLLAVWLTGAIFFLLPVVIGLWQVRSLRRTALPWRHGQSVATRLAAEAGIHRRVEVLLHESVAGPMTCGVLHPAIVLSPDAQTWNEDDLSRAIAHELEHVRRGDWLSHCLARAVCAAYWFHPLVWIAARHLALEAERSCDDAVLSRSEAAAYAEQLVALARHLSTTAKSPLLAMANRSDLAARVNAVLDSRQRRGRAGAFAVALACAAAALLIITISPIKLVAAEQPGPQASNDNWEKLAGGKMSFDVASVKQNTSSNFSPPNFALDDSDSYPGNTTLFSATVALTTCIGFAYKLSSFERQAVQSELPKWATTERFDVQARAATASTKDQMRRMMQALLADRFKLTAHFETNEKPVFALVLVKPGKTGPQLRPYAEDPPCDAAPPGPGAPALKTTVGEFPPMCYAVMGIRRNVNGVGRITWGSRNVTMRQIAKDMASAPTANLDRPVVDQTDLSGNFDFLMDFEAPGPPAAGVPEPDDAAGTFLDALREQLGLKLVSTTGPVDSIVIDHIEEPTPN